MKTLIGLVALFSCLACSPERRDEAAAESSSDTSFVVAAQPDACCAAEDAGQALSDSSIYHLESDWLNQNGENLRLADLRGRVRVVAMIFTHCRYACPRLTADMLAIEAELNKSVLDQIGFVLFSIDPERDTPTVLRDYARDNELDPAHWMLLRGDATDVQDLAAVLGVKYKRGPGGDFSHSNIVSILDQGGKVVFQQEGLNIMPDEAADIIRRLLSAT